MPKTIVCIVEEDMTMNYLFVKEMMKGGDALMLIAQNRDIPKAKHFLGLFPTITKERKKICALAKDGDEDLWDTICRTIRSARKSHGDDVEYHVNLSGGTRLMSIAAQQVLSEVGAKFYFMPVDRNVIIHSQIDDENDNNDDIVSDIKYSLTVKEYLNINNISATFKTVQQPKAYTEGFLELFTNSYFSQNEHRIIAELRDLRNKDIRIPDIEGLSKLLEDIKFPISNARELSSTEIQYLTGGWFEEYIYYFVKNTIKPRDIVIGADVQRVGAISHNDLDVVFTMNNRLFAIECKTGVGVGKKPEKGEVSLYHKMVYKACALKESLLGLRSHAYIFSLNDDSGDRLRSTARNLGITFCDKSVAVSNEKLKNIFLNTKIYL